MADILAVLFIIWLVFMAVVGAIIMAGLFILFAKLIWDEVING